APHQPEAGERIGADQRLSALPAPAVGHRLQPGGGGGTGQPGGRHFAGPAQLHRPGAGALLADGRLLPHLRALAGQSVLPYPGGELYADLTGDARVGRSAPNLRDKPLLAMPRGACVILVWVIWRPKPKNNHSMA